MLCNVSLLIKGGQNNCDKAEFVADQMRDVGLHKKNAAVIPLHFSVENGE